MEGEGEEAETPLPPPNRHRRSKDSQIYCRISEGKCRPKLIHVQGWQFVCPRAYLLRPEAATNLWEGRE